MHHGSGRDKTSVSGRPAGREIVEWERHQWLALFSSQVHCASYYIFSLGDTEGSGPLPVRGQPSLKNGAPSAQRKVRPAIL